MVYNHNYHLILRYIKTGILSRIKFHILIHSELNLLLFAFQANFAYMLQQQEVIKTIQFSIMVICNLRDFIDCSSLCNVYLKT